MSRLSEYEQKVKLNKELSLKSEQLRECLNYMRYAAAFIESYMNSDINAKTVQDMMPAFALKELTK